MNFQQVFDEFKQDILSSASFTATQLISASLTNLDATPTSSNPPTMSVVGPSILGWDAPFPSLIFDDETVSINLQVQSGTYPINRVEFYLNAQGVTPNTTPFRTEKVAPYTFVASDVTAAEYDLVSRVVDSMGNDAEATEFLQVRARLIDPVLPDPTGSTNPSGTTGGGGTQPTQSNAALFQFQMAELVEPSDLWEPVTTDIGTTAYKYVGPNFFNTPGNYPFEINVNVTVPGDYQIVMRSKIDDSATKNSDFNDIWFQVASPAILYGEKGSVMKYSDAMVPFVDGWNKLYQNELGKWSLETDINDGIPHIPFVTFSQPGNYTLRFSPRSNKFALDYIVLFNPNLVSYAQATTFGTGSGVVTPIDPDPVDPIDPTPVDPTPTGSSPIDTALSNSTKRQLFHIKATDYPLGPISENQFRQSQPQWNDVKNHSGDEMKTAFGDTAKASDGTYTPLFREATNPNWIRLVDPKGGTDPWWKKFLAKSTSPIGAGKEGEIAVIEFDLVFPRHSMRDDGTFNGWLPDKHGKFMSGIQLATGVGNTGQNPQPDGFAEVAFGWYGPDSTALITNKDAKGDWYNTFWPAGGMDQGPDSTYLGWGLYVHDRRANYGHKFQQHIYALDNLQTRVRKPFRWDVEYKSRALFKLNTPNQSDGVLLWELSENGAPFKAVRHETDIDYRGNSTGKWADTGFAFFPGGGDGSFLLEGMSRSFNFNNVRVTLL